MCHWKWRHNYWLTSYEEYLRVRMSESMAGTMAGMDGTMTCTPPFVDYDISLIDSLPPWSCCNNLQIAVYLLLGNRIEKTQNVSIICNALALERTLLGYLRYGQHWYQQLLLLSHVHPRTVTQLDFFVAIFCNALALEWIW